MTNSATDEEKALRVEQTEIATDSVRGKIVAFLSGTDDTKTLEAACEEESATNRPSAVLERTGATTEFNKLASAQIEESRNVLNGHLDVLLTFSALFSAAISGVLAISWGLFSAASLPSPLSPTILVNRLITASLTCSLLASFGAVLGKQWLLSYGRITAQSPAGIQNQHQTWIDSAKFWRLHGIVEGVIPMLLQAALILFIVGLIKLFELVNPSISNLNEFIALGGLVAIGGSFLTAFWDPYCPYQTPITQTILPWIAGMAWASVWLAVMPLLLLFLPFRVVTQCFWQQMVKTDGSRSFATQCIQELKKALSPLNLTEMWIGYHFRRWRRIGEEAMERLQSTPPSTSANCGNTTAWLLETSQEHDVLKIAATSFLMTHDEAFIQAFFRRKAIRHARRRWELATRRLSAISMSDSASTAYDYDVKQLGSSIVLYEGVILHAYFSTEEQPKEREECVRSIIWRRIWTKYGRRIATNTDLGDIQPFLDAAYGAAAIEFLLRPTPYEFAFRRVCFQVLRQAATQSTPPPHIILYTFVAAKLARLSKPATESSPAEKDPGAEFRANYMALRRAYSSDETVLLLENVTDAIVAYCDYLQSKGPRRYSLPPMMYPKLLSWAARELLVRSIPHEQIPKLVDMALPFMEAMYRYIFVYITAEDDSTQWGNKRWLKTGQRISQTIKDAGRCPRIEAIDLTERFIFQLDGALLGPFRTNSAQADSTIPEYWTSINVIRLLTVCMMARRARAPRDQPDIIKVYEVLAEFFQRSTSSKSSNHETGIYLAEFQEWADHFKAQLEEETAQKKIHHGTTSQSRTPRNDERTWFDHKKADAAHCSAAEKSFVLTPLGQAQRRLHTRRDVLRQRILASD